MKSKDIFLANVKYDKVDYARPVVIISVYKDSALIGLISSAFDLYKPLNDFLISDKHPAFPFTGLARKSFVKDAPMPELNFVNFQKCLGSLTEDLAKDFDKWLGL